MAERQPLDGGDNGIEVTGLATLGNALRAGRIANTVPGVRAVLTHNAGETYVEDKGLGRTLEKIVPKGYAIVKISAPFSSFDRVVSVFQRRRLSPSVKKKG